MKKNTNEVLENEEKKTKRVKRNYKRKTSEVKNVKEKNKKPGLVTGRIEHNLVVHLTGDESMIGKLVPVRLKECKGFYYIGEPEI